MKHLAIITLMLALFFTLPAEAAGKKKGSGKSSFITRIACYKKGSRVYEGSARDFRFTRDSRGKENGFEFYDPNKGKSFQYKGRGYSCLLVN